MGELAPKRRKLRSEREWLFGRFDWAAAWMLASLCTASAADWGPYPVGQQTLVLIDRQRQGRQIVTEIWYPRQADMTRLPSLDFADAKVLGSPDRYRLPFRRRDTDRPDGPAQVVRNAPSAHGVFPIIMFSHGLTAIRDQSQFLTRFWASHGYVVVAPDHQGNTGYDFNPLELYQSGLERPRDLRFVLSQLWELEKLSDWDLRGRLRWERVAATGHSLGGYTALAFGGAWIHVKGLPIKLEETPRPDFYEIADSRVKCVIAMAPVYRPAFNAQGLAHLNKPTLVLGGDCDTVTPFDQNQRPIYEQIGGPGLLVKVAGASHFSFADESLLADAPFFIKGMHKPQIERNECDRILQSITLDFLDHNLKW